MSWYNFIFSKKKSHRLQRHLVFWLLWWIYFSLSYFHYEQSGLQKIAFEPWSFPFFIKSTLLVCVHMVTCYYFILYLLPRYLLKGRYFELILHAIILCLLLLVSSYFFHKTVLPWINQAFNYNPAFRNQTIWWTSITTGLLSAPKVISAAAAIKLLKRWWLKQKEKERLEKEKLMTDLQLLKAQMHPDFLFSSLDNICLMVQKKNIDLASTLLLKLADILSYILYESDNKLVRLEKEIKTIKDYLLLEKNRLGESLEMDIAVKGEPGDKMITPLLLFSFIKNSFSCIENKRIDTQWINLELHIGKTEFTMKLIHGKSSQAVVQISIENAIAKALKRLDFFYPGNYELKTTVEPEVMMTSLRIVLDEAANENKNNINIPEELSYATI